MKQRFSLWGLIFLTIMMCAQGVKAQDYTVDGITYTLSNGEWSVIGCSETLVDALIKESIDGHPVTSIGEKAFYQIETLKNVLIPETVTKIGKRAFRGCTLLSNITLPESITHLDDYAFYNCGNNGLL